MKKGVVNAYVISGILIFSVTVLGFAVLDLQLISIVIGSFYLVFLLLTKTTNYFSRNLFIMRFEKTVAIIVILALLIIQVTIENYKPAIPILLMTLTMVAIGYLIFSWIYEKLLIIRELKVERLKAELGFLKNQINPHFFFNTLNNLYGLALEKSDRTPDFIFRLSELMRYVIDQGSSEKVRVVDEVSYVKNYLALQAIRYHHRPQIDLIINLEDQSQEIAPLLLTNMIENAFKHGLDTLISGAFLRIRLSNTQRTFTFIIENNFTAQKHNSQSGIGLENLKRRLDLTYPNRHKLDINKTIDTFNVTLNIHLESK